MKKPFIEKISLLNFILHNLVKLELRQESVVGAHNAPSLFDSKLVGSKKNK